MKTELIKEKERKKKLEKQQKHGEPDKGTRWMQERKKKKKEGIKRKQTKEETAPRGENRKQEGTYTIQSPIATTG